VTVTESRHQSAAKPATKGCLEMRHRFFLLAITVVALISPAAYGSDLSGRVTDNKGRPLSGATVLVNTAAPRKGVAVFCPSCYADCSKKTTTDADGQFTIRSLDPSLVFYLVATAEGYRSGASTRIDPAKDKAEIALESLPADLPPDRKLSGRVVDTKGKPVVGAQVSPFGCQQGDNRWWGEVKDADTVSVTNNRGEFVITCKKPAEAFDLEVRSGRHAPKKFELLHTGDKAHELTLESGAFVSGRISKDGKPVRGIAVGLAQVDRNVEGFLGPEQIGTNANGEFLFSAVAPNTDYYIYTLMDSTHGAGSLALRRVKVEKSGTTVKLGDLELAGSHTLAGRIVLSDGAPLKGPIQLLADREGAWDSQRAMVDSDGAFRFENIPDQEPISFTARVPGYVVSHDRNKFQICRTSVAMFVEGPRDDIEIVFEPAKKGSPRK
jgi:hypothetical protein